MGIVSEAHEEREREERDAREQRKHAALTILGEISFFLDLNHPDEYDYTNAREAVIRLREQIRKI